MKFSIIYGYRNRETERIKRCLDSLSIQTDNDFEVVFIDYGSDNQYREMIETLVQGYSFAHYYYSETNGWVWNRAHALNTGIGLSSGEYVIFSDVDLIYPDDFISYFKDRVQPDTVFFNQVYWLPEKFKDWKNLKAYTDELPMSGKAGLGGCCVIEKKILEKIKGYDEYYAFWGIEDRDIHHRLQLMGIKEEWADSDSQPIFHQWHEKSYYGSSFLPERWWTDFNLYYFDNKNNLDRNKSGWGKLLKKKDRPTLIASDVKPIDINSFGNGNAIQEFLSRLEELLEILPHSTVLELKINKKNPIYHGRKLAKLRKLIVEILIRPSLFLIRKWSFLRGGYTRVCSTHIANRDFHFEPLLDIPYIIWKLYNKTEIIKDYNIMEDQEWLTIHIR